MQWIRLQCIYDKGIINFFESRNNSNWQPVQRICKYPLLLKVCFLTWDSLTWIGTHQGNWSKGQWFTQITRGLWEDWKYCTNSQWKEEGKWINSKNYWNCFPISWRRGRYSRNYVHVRQQYELVTPTRRYLREGELHHYASNGKYKPGYFFLFNDLFLYTKKKGNKYYLKLFAPFAYTAIRFVSTYGKQWGFGTHHLQKNQLLSLFVMVTQANRGQ